MDEIARLEVPVYSPREDLSSDEIRQRVSILKRLRELLLEQRNRFRSYLEVLDKEKDAIEKGGVDDLNAYVELEEKIVADVFAIRKVIDPLEEMYRACIEPPDAALKQGRARDKEVTDLKKSLDVLKNEAAARSERNRELLSKRMTDIHSEIQTLRNNSYTRRRPTFPAAALPSLVDIEG